MNTACEKKFIIIDFHKDLHSLDTLIFVEIFPLEYHWMEGKKRFQLCEEGVGVNVMSEFRKLKESIAYNVAPKRVLLNIKSE